MFITMLNVNETRSKFVFVFLVVIFVVMDLFPPHIDETYQNLHDGGTRLVSEEINYRFLGNRADNGVYFYTESRISYGCLLIQWFMVVVIGFSYLYYRGSGNSRRGT